MGTPEFAAAALAALVAWPGGRVVGVVTQPDRPAGRRQQLTPPPVKVLAEQHGIAVFQPEKIRRAEAVETLRAWDADVFIVAAFGQILPQTVLDLPPHGSLNIHASLLPRWRGAAPIQAAIRAGDRETGITLMKMDAGLDTGPMLSREAIAIGPDETGGSLHDRLMHLGADLLIRTLPAYLSGALVPQPQPEAGVTFAGRIEKDEGRIDWAQPADLIARTARAFEPWPSAYTVFAGKRLKLFGGGTAPGAAEPGRVVMHEGAIAIGTGNGLYRPARVQLEGRGILPEADFARGTPAFVGARLGESGAG
jgi:methionyl-tRNA formyltransferase